MKAFGYVRVKGKEQVEGDRLIRQEKAIKEYATSKGIEILKIYRERGVIGTLANRPVLAEMIVDMENNGHDVKAVIVEKLFRLARDVMIQESIIQNLRDSGVKPISVLEGDGLIDADPTRRLVRQVLSAITEYEKSMLVAKLRVARQRMKAQTGKCEGRKSYREAAPETVEYIKRLRRKPKGSRRKTYKEIAQMLNFEGIPTLNGQPLNLQTVRHVLL